jgi:tRNA pseudouridine55 synthase
MGPIMARRKKGLAISGWIVLDKDLDMGSTTAVSRVRRLFNAKKAGHAGTLDPLATGILPIALGEATKTVAYMVEADKAYRFTIAWGTSTASFDREGAVTATSDHRPQRAEIEQALLGFEGEIDQVPPNYSAIKVDGERAYDLARDGVAFALDARRVTIHQARLVAVPDPDHAVIEIRCGKGTYVRALARDLAAVLGACGHVSDLRRTRVGVFGEDQAIRLETLEDLGHKSAASEALLPVETALDDIPALAVTVEEAFRLKQGRPIVLLPRQVETLRAGLVPRSIGGQDASRTVLATRDGIAVSLCEMRAGQLSPTRVFHLEQGDTDVDYA